MKRCLHKSTLFLLASLYIQSMLCVNSCTLQKAPLYIEENSQMQGPREPKDWTFLVYMAADNDLRGFAARNIKQMAAIGSNKHINILIHLDIRVAGNRKITRRYYVEKDKIILLNGDDQTTQKMDSGSPETLVNFCQETIKYFPAHHYALVLWNHGTGIIDPLAGKIINPSNFFRINSITNKWELDRTLGFLDSITIQNERGVCWDDSTGNFLTNQTLEYALNKICSTSLNGGRFAIIGFDACLMSMLEIGNIIKNYADFMIASEEVEMGTGWKYDKVLSPFATANISPALFASHIVKAYDQTYSKITDDYTLSAVDCAALDSLEENIHYVSELLLQALEAQFGTSVKNVIKSCKSKLLCTCFDEPTYKDLGHFYANLKSSLRYAVFHDTSAGNTILKTLYTALNEGLALIQNAVIANCVGPNLSKATGISIYFPDHKIHASYNKTTFAQNNKWTKLIKTILG